MLLNIRKASIPCSSRHSLSCMNDVQNMFKNRTANPIVTFASRPPVTTALQYFNMRVTQRLHRYRSMKKQWHEVATSVQNVSSLSPTCESPVPYLDSSLLTQDIIKNINFSIQKQTVEAKSYCINDYINATAVAKDNQKNSIELDPLHSRIQQDLIKLRRLIKTNRRKLTDNASLKTSTSRGPAGDATSIGTTFDNQENNNKTVIRKTSSLNKLKPLDRVKIAGCQMRRPTLPKSDSSDSGIGSTSNSSSTCSHYSKKLTRENNNKTFNIYRSRINPPPPPPPSPPIASGSFTYRASLPKKKLNTSSKMAQNTPTKQLLPSRFPISQVPPVIKKKQPSFTKQETPLPPIRLLSDSGAITNRVYSYAASSSLATPRSMILKRSTSLLPILLQSSSCIGIRPREARPKKTEYDVEDEQEENNTQDNDDDDDDDDDDYFHLLEYKHLINRLPKPIISIRPRYGQDDYGVLFEQIDHIRGSMPNSNTYADYARIV